jgi:hypothetical protein
MKKQITVALLGLALMFAMVVTASARDAGTMRIYVPFDFNAGGKQLHAGSYTVRRARTDGESALVIRSEDGRNAAIVITNSGGAPASRATMSFRQYGERYFLAEVSIPGTASVRQLPKVGAEKKAERELIEEAKADSGVKAITIVGSLK